MGLALIDFRVWLPLSSGSGVGGGVVGCGRFIDHEAEVDEDLSDDDEAAILDEYDRSVFAKPRRRRTRPTTTRVLSVSCLLWSK